MNKIASLLAATLLLANPFARAEDDRSLDLRYCLDLPTAEEIAKCSGEISPGDKGRTYSREEVERILSEQKASAPASESESESSSAPATVSDDPNNTATPEMTESGN